MSDALIWRYLSLAKYVDLLETQSLFFPKASLFPDSTEGTWITHTLLRELSQHYSGLESDAQALEELLARAGEDQSAILREAKALLLSGRDNVRGVLRDVLSDVGRVFPHKRREYIESMIISWRKVRDNHVVARDKNWLPEVRIHRECTYISCWNRGPSMSHAMWQMYAGGLEGVAVRSNESKLRAVINYNTAFLEEHELTGSVAEVQYFEGLTRPSEEIQQQVKDILVGAIDTRIGQFRIKPSIFEYEHEVRAIIFPKHNPFDPVDNPYPRISGFALPVGRLNAESDPSITRFIDAVHIHPTLGPESMAFKVVTELNKRFGAEAIPVVADPIEPFGT
jgi:hypothetical protein